MSNITSTPSLSTRINSWFSNMPITTKTVIIVCSIFQIWNYLFGDVTFNICHQTYLIIYQYEVWRIISGAWFHGGLLHIVFNMVTFEAIGPKIERKQGSLNFIYNLFLFDILGSIIHESIAYLLFKTNTFTEFMYECTVGLSGVIFTLLVINMRDQESPTMSVFGFFRVPTKLYPWVLLVIMQIIMPNVSFLGHLSGIMVGFLYSYGYLGIFQPPSWILNYIESSTIMGWLVSRNSYISNPHLGNSSVNSNTIPLNVLPIFKTNIQPPSSFGGTGYVLGTGQPVQ